MSVSIAPQAARQSGVGSLAAPSFLGIVRGELFKVIRSRMNWVLLAMVTAVIVLPHIFLMNSTDSKTTIAQAPEAFLYAASGILLAVERAFVGLFLLAVTSRMVGLEFQYGTVRIMLARGVGRAQLLLAKVTAMTVVALVVFVAGLLLNALLTLLDLQVLTGNLDALKSLSQGFWTSTEVNMLTVLISMFVSILLAVAVTILSRSLAFGTSAALGWFAADNFLVLMMLLVSRVTGNDLWLKLTAYLLGPELNIMPAVVAPTLNHAAAQTLGIPPLVAYDGTHALVVALIYGLIFAITPFVLFLRRDVVE